MNCVEPSLFVQYLMIMPNLAIFGAFFSGLLTRDYAYLYLGIGTLILGPVLNFVFKKIFKSLGSISLFERPNPPPYGCSNLLAVCGNKYTGFGMPSGHAQTMGVFATFLSLYVNQNPDYNSKHKILIISIVWIWTFLVCWSRIHIGCHNLLQVGTGLILGIGLGYGLFRIYKKE